MFFMAGEDVTLWYGRRWVLWVWRSRQGNEWVARGFIVIFSIFQTAFVSAETNNVYKDALGFGALLNPWKRVT